MNLRIAAILLGFAVSSFPVCAGDANLIRPKAGKVEIFPRKDLKPVMKATAWTVFQGTEPEPVPIEIVGFLKNAWGPNQDVVVGKMGGKAVRTNVAGGMSGSPVYIDGKLIGAVALRMTSFSPDAICGITPIELMLEINQFDQTRPVAAAPPIKLPDGSGQNAPAATFRGGTFAGRTLSPIATPLMFAGFNEDVLRDYAPLFDRMGVTAVQGGAGNALTS